MRQSHVQSGFILWFLSVSILLVATIAVGAGFFANQYFSRGPATENKVVMQAEGLKNASFVVYHNNWSYLTDWLGINVAVSLETHHGHPPTTSHLEAVLQNVKQKDVKAILVAPFESEDAANWLSERTNIPVLHLPYTVGGSENVDTLEALFTETIAILNGENE